MTVLFGCLIVALACVVGYVIDEIDTHGSGLWSVLVVACFAAVMWGLVLARLGK